MCNYIENHNNNKISGVVLHLRKLHNQSVHASSFQLEQGYSQYPTFIHMVCA